MKKILFLLLASVLLIVPAFAAVDMSSAAQAASDEANTIVNINNDIQNADKDKNSAACVSDSDCIAAQCCHAISAVNKAYAPDCSGIICTADCQSGTVDCGGKIKCTEGKCKAVAAPDALAQNKTENKSASIFVKLSVSNRTKAKNMSELEEMRTEKQNELISKFAGQKNQNSVRLAVHTLLAMEDLEDGIGRNVSAIARDFDNSINKTLQAEQKIQKRSGIARFFLGGDSASANAIEATVAQNNKQIEKLTELKNSCTSCSTEVKAMIDQQITAMELENTRLQNLATAEKAKKGIFGFLKRSK